MCVILVDPDHPSLNLVGDAMSSAQILRPESRRQSVGRVVCQRDRLRLVMKRHEDAYRPKHFLLENRHLRGDLGNHGRRVKVAMMFASIEEWLASFQHLSPLSYRCLNVVVDALALALADKWPHCGPWVQRIAHLLRPCDRAEPIHNFCEDRLMHEHPTAGTAILPRVFEQPDGDSLKRCVQVRIREDDLRRLPAQLQLHVSDAVSRRMHDLAPDLGGPSKRDHSDITMMDQCFTSYRPKPWYNIEQPGGNTSLQRKLTQHEACQRRFLSRLQDDRVAHSQRWRNFQTRQRQWVIPGNNCPHHT